VASFPLILFLPAAARDQLHAVGDNVCTSVLYQKVNVVAGQDIVEQRKTEGLLRFENSTEIRPSISRKLQEKALWMAAMRDVPDVSRQEMTIGVRHRLLSTRFSTSKCGSNRSDDAF
jgi:hypothetical protein